MTEDERFYEVYVAPMETRMARAIWRVVRDPDRVRDVLQDALATVWKRRDYVRKHPNPEALVLKICINASCDALRRERRYRRVEDPEVRSQLLTAVTSGRAASPGNPGVDVLVRAAVARLPRNQAVAALLRLVEDEPYETIAQTLGCSAATARIHVMRARARLSRMLSSLAPRLRREDADE